MSDGDSQVSACSDHQCLVNNDCLPCPDAIDLRPEMTAIKRQGSRNTCSAFAANGLLEFLIKKETGTEISISESFTYWSGKTVAPDSDYVRKTYSGIDGMPGYLAVLGLGKVSMNSDVWPYETKNWLQSRDSRCIKRQDGSYETACFTGIPPVTAKVLPFAMKPVWIERQSISNFILTEKKPVVFNIDWYFDLFDKDGNLTRLPTKDEARECNAKGIGCGGHVVLLVGFDKQTGRFIFRNSWGGNWGTGGYGTLPEDFIVHHCEVCNYFAKISLFKPEGREFVKKVSMGVSAELTK